MGDFHCYNVDMDTLFSIFFSFLSSFFFPGAEETSYLPSMIATTTAEVVEVVDGDTIRVLIDTQVQSIRYIGIDTPEPYRDELPACFSTEASQRNAELVEGRSVELVIDTENTDRYDRLLRYVYVDGVLVNQVLLEEGYAKVLPINPNTKFKERFKKAETQAKEAELGLWKACS